MKFWKRNAVIATVVLFVCVALYLSWSYNRGGEEEDYLSEMVFTDDGATSTGDTTEPYSEELTYTDDSVTATDYFTDERLNRQKARDSALSILKELSAQENLTDAEREKANSEISTLATQALSEAKIEGLVVAKGFVDCVTYINESGISVVVAPTSLGLTATDVVKIKDIVVGETSFGAGDIRVMEAQAS